MIHWLIRKKELFTCPTESRLTLCHSSSPASPSVLESSWKSNWDSLSFWSELCLLDVSPHQGYLSFSFCFCIHNLFQSELHSVVMFYPLSTSPACCHWLEETHPLPNQKRPDWAKTSKYRQGAELCRHSHHHTWTEAQKWWLIGITFAQVCLVFWENYFKVLPLKVLWSLSRHHQCLINLN